VLVKNGEEKVFTRTRGQADIFTKGFMKDTDQGFEKNTIIQALRFYCAEELNGVYTENEEFIINDESANTECANAESANAESGNTEKKAEKLSYDKI
jgi:hypothetical protein